MERQQSNSTLFLCTGGAKNPINDKQSTITNMKAKLFQRNDGTKIAVIIPDGEPCENIFKIKDIPFEGALQNEFTFIGLFESIVENAEEELISLLDADVLITIGKDLLVKYLMSTNHRYLSIQVPSIEFVNNVYSIMLLLNQFSSIKHKLNL